MNVSQACAHLGCCNLNNKMLCNIHENKTLASCFCSSVVTMDLCQNAEQHICCHQVEPEIPIPYTLILRQYCFDGSLQDIWYFSLNLPIKQLGIQIQDINLHWQYLCLPGKSLQHLNKSCQGSAQPNPEGNTMIETLHTSPTKFHIVRQNWTKYVSNFSSSMAWTREDVKILMPLRNSMAYIDRQIR